MFNIGCNCVYMYVVKKCGRSKKNLLASTVKYKEIFDLIQTDWKTDYDTEDAKASRYDITPDEPVEPRCWLGLRVKQTRICLTPSHYHLILQLYKEHVPFHMASLILKYREHTSENFCFLHNWSPDRALLTPSEHKWKNKIAESATIGTRPMKITRARFGDALFCTAEYQIDKEKVNDNRCVMMRFKEDENKEETISYGIITHMYYHRLFHDQDPRVVLVADWYDPVGIDDYGLVEVQYNSLFETEKAAFLDECYPLNFMLWPSEPFEFDWTPQSYRDKENRFVVIHR